MLIKNKCNFSIVVISIVSILMFFSCNNNLIEEELFRNIEDPFYDVPVTDSLTLEGVIYLNWKEDDASDCYYLYRATDQQILSFERIYEGKKTEYVDKNILSSKKYIYRLDKVRGNKTFIGKNYAYGFCSLSRKDNCENNDVESNASFLEYDLNCNIPCVKYITNSIVDCDTDWFYITLPPCRQADIVINQTGIEDNKTTNLKYQIQTAEAKIVTQNKAFQISNKTYTTAKLYFKIIPDTQNFDSYFCTNIEYIISLNQIYSLNN